MASVLVNLLLVALAGAGQSATSETGRVVGRVVDAETGAPIAGVRVSLNGPISPNAPWPPVPPQERPATTSPPQPPDPSIFLVLERLTSETRADGLFEIRDVPKGRWAIQAQREGFVMNRVASMPIIDMDAGRSLSAPDIRLDRGGVVTGRVLDARGNPMSRASVRTTQFNTLADGTIRTTGGSSGAETNDSGEFRLSGLAPGVHYVVAQPRPAFIPIIGGSAPPQSQSTYVATFYPGVANPAVASPVNVVRGATTPAINFSMVSVPAYQVSGIVVDSEGQPVAGAIVRLATRMPFGTSMQSAPSQSNGSFRITNVSAGTYGVMAAVPRVRTNGPATTGSLSFGDAARPGAAPEVTIQSDVGALRVVAARP